MVLRRRRLLAALLVAVAVAAGVRAVAGPPPETRALLVAARDLPAGHLLAADDLEERRVAPEAVAAGVVADPVGQLLSTPVRRGEQVTDVRLLRGGLLASYPDLSAVPVRIPDAGAVALLTAGDRIDLIATDPQGGGSEVLLEDAPVLALPPETAGDAMGGGPTGGRLVVIGVSPELRDEVADAAVLEFLSISLNR